MEFWHAAAIAVFVVSLLWFNENLDKTEVTEWLEEQGKGHLADYLEEAGVITLHDLAEFSSKRIVNLRLLEVRREVHEVAKDARGWLDLIDWLERHKLEDVLPVLKGSGVVSLDRLKLLSETEWTAIKKSGQSLSLQLKVQKVADVVRQERWDENSQGSDGYGFVDKVIQNSLIGMIMLYYCLLSVCLCITCYLYSCVGEITDILLPMGIYNGPLCLNVRLICSC